MIKRTAALLVLFALVASLTGCGGTDNPRPADSGKISLFSYGMDRFDGADKDSVWKEIEKRAKVTLSLSGVSLNSYTEKINMMINTSEAPDIFFYLADESEPYARWANQGMLLNLDEYVKDGSAYPNLYRLVNSYEYKNLQYGDKHTLVPFVSVQNNWTIYIRQDWLDKLGLPQPKTLEDYAKVMEAFTKNDPDGNGKNDTYGLAGCKDSFWFMPFFAAYVLKDDWLYNSDKTAMDYHYNVGAYKDYLAYMADLYAKGYIVKDYYTKTDDMKIEDFATGKAGVLIHNAGDYLQTIMEKTEKASPNAVVDLIPPPEGPQGANLVGWGGWWGGYSISAACKDPEAALRLLELLISEEGQKLRYYGIENVHYTEKDSSIEITAQNLANRAAEPPNTFNNVKWNGDLNEPYGFYAWGPLIGSQFSTDSEKITPLYDYTYYKYRELAVKAEELCRKYETIPDFYNIAVSDAGFLQTVKKLQDYANIYSINIIAGEKTLDAGWNEYMQKCADAGYAKAAQMAYQATKDAGK